MTTHTIEPTRATLHGCFSRDLEPVLEIEPGDTVIYRTLDSSWGNAGRRHFTLDLPEFERDRERDGGHALCGPVLVRGAQPGDTLEVRIERVVPERWGWTWAGPGNGTGDDLGLDHEVTVKWELDAARGVATDASGLGLVVPIRPFMGVMGNAPAAPGYHSTIPPRAVGGNLDCRELVAGSTLWLPVEVEGALFSVGDGHAAQGDGEVSRLAIECPMEEVALTFHVRCDLPLRMPEAQTPAGYLTLGLGETLDQAQKVALKGMLDHLQRTTNLDRSQAMALASCVVHLRVTQIVNDTVGIHALLPPGAFSITEAGASPA
jgi:acetamidase/formamidase